jgi:hypothetical protein
VEKLEKDFENVAEEIEKIDEMFRKVSLLFDGEEFDFENNFEGAIDALYFLFGDKCTQVENEKGVDQTFAKTPLKSKL